MHIHIALEIFMKACTFMFMDAIYLGVRRPFLGQNLPQNRNVHKVGGDIRLVGSRMSLWYLDSGILDIELLNPLTECGGRR